MKIIALFLVMSPFLSYAGKIEVRIGKKIHFYQAGGNYITILPNLKCKGSENKVKNGTILDLECVVDGVEFFTTGICPDGEFGTAYASITTKKSEVVSITHHCNGLTIK